MTEQLGQLSLTQPAHWRLSAIRLHWGTLCFITGNGAHVCWIEEKYMVIHIYGITLKNASSYSYQSSSLISYLMYNDLHHDCKPYQQTREFYSVSRGALVSRYFLDTPFMINLPEIRTHSLQQQSGAQSEAQADWGTAISAAEALAAVRTTGWSTVMSAVRSTSLGTTRSAARSTGRGTVMSAVRITG